MEFTGMKASVKTLSQAVAENPFADYQDWWPMGHTFIRFIADAIFSEWSALHRNTGKLQIVQTHVKEYLEVVYARDPYPTLVEDFGSGAGMRRIQSGEFDALSYAFFRSAFELISAQSDDYSQPVGVERRQFTKRVGKRFYQLLHAHLDLDLPNGLDSEQKLQQLKMSIQVLGDFLRSQGYFREHFRFAFSVEVKHAGRWIQQTEESFLNDLSRNGMAYALYEMGYPAILPSAVYLYNTLGEAQHHSSRTIEEVLRRVGYEGHETDDFDPTAFPSDRVVELWEIKGLTLEHSESETDA